MHRTQKAIARSVITVAWGVMGWKIIVMNGAAAIPTGLVVGVVVLTICSTIWDLI